MQNSLAIGMLLLPAFNSLAANAFIDPFRVANYLQNNLNYKWEFLSLSGGDVTASNNWVTSKTIPYQESDVIYDFLVINASWTPENFQEPQLKRWLNQQSHHKTVLIGIDTGAFVIAYAGLLNNSKAVVHYEHNESFKESFPKIPLKQGLFEIDDNCMTCCGGLASADLATEIIRMQQGIDLSNAVSYYIFKDRLRTGQEKQNTHESVGYAMPETLQEAIILMERNIEEPLGLTEIAHYAGISQRQLARLFNKYTETTPIKYYINIRLEQARKLVTQTELSLIEISGMCGFKHAEQLSRGYKSRFGMPPKKHRIEARIPFQFRNIL